MQSTFDPSRTPILLRKDPAALSYRLDAVLKKYQELANSKPVNLRDIFPASEVWRIFIDGDMHHDGWERFEKREPGYLKAMYGCFQIIYDFSTVLTPELIKLIHKTATFEVKRTNYEKEEDRNGVDPATRIGEFRTALPIDYHVGGCYFSTSKDRSKNATLDGIEEFLNKEDRVNSWHAISIQLFFHPCTSTFEDVLVSKALITSLRDIISKRPDVTDEELVREVRSHIYVEMRGGLGKRGIKALATALRQIGRTNNTKDLAHVFYELADEDAFEHDHLRFLMTSVQMVDTPEQLYKDVRHYLDGYHRAIKTANSQMDKLKIIIALVQDLEQLHPYSDANCRTFCMALLNYLLVRNGFPFVILQDPNQFDMHSRQELLAAVIEGMENTFKLIETKKLYGYEVKEEDFDSELFRHLEALEKNNREKAAHADAHSERSYPPRILFGKAQKPKLTHNNASGRVQDSRHFHSPKP